MFQVHLILTSPPAPPARFVVVENESGMAVLTLHPVAREDWGETPEEQANRTILRANETDGVLHLRARATEPGSFHLLVSGQSRAVVEVETAVAQAMLEQTFPGQWRQLIRILTDYMGRHHPAWRAVQEELQSTPDAHIRFDSPSVLPGPLLD